MGCMRPRRPQLEVRPEQKWDAISLNDFKSTSCFTPFAYAYLYFSLLLSCAVYGVDTFTAVNLIAFNRWSSEIAPTQLIPFSVSRWIFAVCIILGFINLAFEHIRARRIMKRGSVAECYLDSLAVRLESVRMGRGQGWKRFLVFAELTKSKKGAEYVALFTYFSFQSWIRVIICSGPRQAVNALTLLAVYNAKLSASGTTLENTLLSFFDKIRALALEDSQQALILCGMLFTLVIWVFSFLSLLLGAVFFVFFLWGYIPRSDGGLSAYCERKINKRLMKIVSAKINKAMAEDERRRRKAELKAAKKAGEIAPTALQATLPDVGDDKLPEMPMLGRNDTMTTLPAYTSRPGTPGSFELNSLDQKRPVPSRTMTASSSATAYSARAPLMGAAAELGINRTASPAPSLPSVDLNNYPPARTGTSNSNRNFGPMQPNRGPTNGYDGAYTASPATYSSETMPALPPPIRSPLGAGNGYGRPPPPNQYNGRSTPNGSRPPPFDEYSSGMSSPAPSGYSSPRGPISPRGPAQGGYPVRSATNPVPPRGPGSPYAPQRNMTAPIQPQHQASSSGASDYFNRPNTASSQRGFQPQHQNTGSSASDYRPPTSQSQRGVNRPGFGNGWAGDVEAQRGPGPRY